MTRVYLSIDVDGSVEPLVRLFRHQTSDGSTIVALGAAQSIREGTAKLWEWKTGDLDPIKLQDLAASVTQALTNALWIAEGQQQRIEFPDVPVSADEPVSAPPAPSEPTDAEHCS